MSSRIPPNAVSQRDQFDPLPETTPQSVHPSLLGRQVIPLSSTDSRSLNPISSLPSPDQSGLGKHAVTQISPTPGTTTNVSVFNFVQNVFPTPQTSPHLQGPITSLDTSLPLFQPKKPPQGIPQSDRVIPSRQPTVIDLTEDTSSDNSTIPRPAMKSGASSVRPLKRSHPQKDAGVGGSPKPTPTTARLNQLANMLQIDGGVDGIPPASILSHSKGPTEEEILAAALLRISSLLIINDRLERGLEAPEIDGCFSELGKILKTDRSVKGIEPTSILSDSEEHTQEEVLAGAMLRIESLKMIEEQLKKKLKDVKREVSVRRSVSELEKILKTDRGVKGINPVSILSDSKKPKLAEIVEATTLRIESLKVIEAQLQEKLKSRQSKKMP